MRPELGGGTGAKRPSRGPIAWGVARLCRVWGDTSVSPDCQHRNDRMDCAVASRSPDEDAARETEIPF